MGSFRCLNAGIVRITVCANDVSGLVNAEKTLEVKNPPAASGFRRRGFGLEAGHDRSAGLHIVADLLTLAVAQHGDIRQHQRAIFTDPFQLEPVFMHKVECEPAAKQHIVDALRGLVHIGA